MYTQTLFVLGFEDLTQDPQAAYDAMVAQLSTGTADDTAGYVAACEVQGTMTQSVSWEGDELKIVREWDDSAYTTYETMLAARDVAESSLVTSGFTFTEFVLMPNGEPQPLPRD